MNKQEAIEKVKNLNARETFMSEIIWVKRDDVLDIIKQLDEPERPPEPKPLELEKPVVPQFVADWYEEYKNYFEYNLYNLCVDFHERKLQEDLHEWFNCLSNKPIETLVMMHKFGYEVEKEKLYTVELPNPNGDSNMYGLCKVDGRIIIGTFVFGLNKAINTKLTEAEIKEDFEWAWKWAEEVKDEY